MEKEVNISLIINGIDQNIKSLDDLNKVVKAYNKEAKEAKKITEENTEETKKNTEETKKANDEKAKTTKVVEDNTSAYGQLKKRIGDATESLRGIIGGMKTLKGALITSGIGAFVVLLGSVISYFKSSEEGAKKFKIALEAVNIFFGKIMELIVPLGKEIVALFENPKESLIAFGNLLVSQITNRLLGLVKLIPELGKAVVKLFEGDFKGAAITATDAVGSLVLGVNNITDVVTDAAGGVKDFFNDVSKAASDSIDEATKLINAQSNLRKTTNALKIENAQLNKELQKQIKIAEDTTLSYDERKAALQEIDKLQIKQAENLAKQAGLEVQAIQLQIQATANVEDRKELEGQLADAIANRINAETELEQVRLDAGKTSRELDLEELNRKQSINAILAKIDIENSENALKRRLNEIDEEAKASQIELTNLKATEEEKAAIRAFYDDLRKKAVEENEKEIKNIIDNFNKAEFEERQNRIETQGLTEFEIRVKEIEKEAELRRADIEANFIAEEQKLKDRGASVEQITALEQRKAEAIKGINQDEVDFKIQVAKLERDTKISAAGDIANQLAGLLGESSAAGKAASVAAATINTYEAASAANAAYPPPFNTIAMALSIAQGLIQVKKILAVKTPGNKSVGAPTISAPVATPFDPTMALRNEQQVNRTMTLEQRGTATAVKAYVVSSDMTNQQEIDSKIKNLSKL